MNPASIGPWACGRMYPKSRFLRAQKGRRRGSLSSTEAPEICHCPWAVVRSFMKNRTKPNQLFGEKLSLRRCRHSRSFSHRTKHLSPTNCGNSNFTTFRGQGASVPPTEVNSPSMAVWWCCRTGERVDHQRRGNGCAVSEGHETRIYRRGTDPRRGNILGSTMLVANLLIL